MLLTQRQKPEFAWYLHPCRRGGEGGDERTWGASRRREDGGREAENNNCKKYIYMYSGMKFKTNIHISLPFFSLPPSFTASLTFWYIRTSVIPPRPPPTFSHFNTTKETVNTV